MVRSLTSPIKPIRMMPAKTYVVRKKLDRVKNDEAQSAVTAE